MERNEADYTANAGYMLPERVGSFRFLATGYKNKLTRNVDGYSGIKQSSIILVLVCRLSAYFHVPPRTLDGYSDVIWRPFARIWMPFVGFMVVTVCVLKLLYSVPVSDALTLTIGNISQQGKHS